MTITTVTIKMFKHLLKDMGENKNYYNMFQLVHALWLTILAGHIILQHVQPDAQPDKFVIFMQIIF